MSKFKYFLCGLLVLMATLAFGVDKKITAPNGNLILDAATGSTVKSNKLLEANSGVSTVSATSGAMAVKGTGNTTSSQSGIEIGQNSGDAKITVQGPTYTTNGLFRQDAFSLSADDNLSGGLILGARHASGGIDFYAGGTSDSFKRMSLLSDGNFGVGTSTPSTKLHVVGDVTIGGTYRLDKNTANPTHVNDFICTTSIPGGGSQENIFSITFSNSSAHTGSARVLITSDGETGGTGFGSRIRELHINWIQGTAMGVTSLHDTNIGAPPSISYTVATNVITFYATSGANTSHFCHSIEIQGQTGVYGQYGLTYTRYGD